MCGRYTLKTSGAELASVFNLAESPALEPTYNVAPTHIMPIIHADSGRRSVMRAQWGLVPFWAKTRKIGLRMINARSETAHTSGAFRSAMRKRRCIVPADGWYEWKKMERSKQPYRFHRTDERPFAIAGLYEHWVDPEIGDVLDSFTVLTTSPNDLAAAVHDRMPVLLHERDWNRWLNPDENGTQCFEQLFLPWDEDDLVATPVSTSVGNVRNNERALIERVEIGPVQGTLF